MFHTVVDGKVGLILAVHIDDVVIAESDKTCSDFHAAPGTKFHTNILGELTWCTGYDFKRDWELGTLEITQKAFIESIVNRFAVNSFSDIPATPGAELGRREEGERGEDWPYSEVVGTFMWLLTMARLDIPHAARGVARYSHNPTERYWKSVLKIMDYLHGTRFLGLTFVRGSGLDSTAYSDACYADKSNDKRSVSRTVIILGGAIVSRASSTRRCGTFSTRNRVCRNEGRGEGSYVCGRSVVVYFCTAERIMCPGLPG